MFESCRGHQKLTPTLFLQNKFIRYCEERSDAAIHLSARKNGLPRCARNDVTSNLNKNINGHNLTIFPTNFRR